MTPWICSFDHFLYIHIQLMVLGDLCTRSTRSFLFFHLDFNSPHFLTVRLLLSPLLV